MGEDGALARGSAVSGLGDATVKIGQVGVGEARAVGHALAQRELGKIAQPFDGVDFTKFDTDGGTLTLDTDDSQMTGFRDRLHDAIVAQPGPGTPTQ